MFIKKCDFKCIKILAKCDTRTEYVYTVVTSLLPYLLTLPLFVGVSRVRALSPAWTGSHARETLISRTHLFLPHDIPPTKKSSTIKS